MVVLKLLIALPERSCILVPIWWTSTLRDQPCSTAAAAYQRRVSGSLSFSSSAMWWYQGNCARPCTIASSGHASANDRMYLRFGGENPVVPGNACFKSAARRSMTFVPQPSLPCLSKISLPMVQFRGDEFPGACPGRDRRDLHHQPKRPFAQLNGDFLAPGSSQPVIFTARQQEPLISWKTPGG